MNKQVTDTALNRSQIYEIVTSSLQEVLAMVNGDVFNTATITGDTCLVGQNAALDSMGLVTLIVEVEQRLEETCGLVLVLADERAMSQKNSPFRTVQSLTYYICRLAQQDQDG